MLKMTLNSANVADKIAEFLDTKRSDGVSEKTLKTYSTHLNTIFSDRLKNDFKTTTVKEAALAVISNESISEYSKTSYMTVLRNFCKTLDIDVKLPKTSHQMPIKQTYTDDEVRKLLVKPKTNSFAEYRTYCIVLLVCDTGMRAGSIRNIKIEDLDLENKVVNVRHTKTGKVQVLPFSTASQKALKTYLQARRGTIGDYLFCDVYENKLSENALRLAVARYNKSRGVSKTSIHMLRHTFARNWLVKCDGNVFTLQKMLGHSTLEMSRHYCNLWDKDIIEGYKSPVEMIQRKMVKMG